MKKIAKIMGSRPTKASQQRTGQTPAAVSRGWGWGSAIRQKSSTHL